MLWRVASTLARSPVHCTDVDVVHEELSVEWQFWELELISFFMFLHSWKRNTRPQGLDLMSSLYLFPKSSQM